MNTERLLDVVSVKETVHGEMPYIGTPCLLVRFGRCNLKCKYCDTDFDTYTSWRLEDLAKVINESKLHHVLITGGEPLIQPHIEALLKAIRLDKRITIETNGSILVTDVVTYIAGNITYSIDVKLFDGLAHFDMLNLKATTPGDVYKFVFWDTESFNLSKQFYLTNRNNVSWYTKWVWSPTTTLLKTSKMRDFVEEVIELQRRDIHMEVYFQTQLHKILEVI